MEESETEETFAQIVDGVQIDSGLTSPHFATNKDKQIAELENTYVLIVSSRIPSIRKIQNVLEHVIKNKKRLLIVADVDQQVKSALLMNKVKGNIKVNIVDLPGFGPTKDDTVQDLAFLTGATVINEELGDDLDAITIDDLGEADYAETDDKNTVLTIDDMHVKAEGRIEDVIKKISEEKNGFVKKSRF